MFGAEVHDLINEY